MKVPPCDILLVQVPYAALERPSLALGLLQSVLRGAGFSTRTLCANLWFAREIGLEAYAATSGTPAHSLLGEWTFSGAAFPDFQPDHDAYLARLEFPLAARSAPSNRLLASVVREVREAALGFVTRLAKAVAASGAKIVGCTSTFQQHVGSLALLRAVRELRPEIVTLMGGANCEAEMGLTTHRNFPWVDYVVSGEAEELISDLVRGILEGRGAPLPLGVIGPAHRATPPAQAPRVSIHRLDSIPSPDFDDYFQDLERTGLCATLVPGLPVEMSRGCWWGQKHHCTFCGLNGGNMGYRSKSPETVTGELRMLAERYGVRRFLVVDNILDMAYFKSVLPQVTGLYELFFETKANLRKNQLHTLRESGARWIQPGFESMHDEVLRLMDKGTTAMMNLQLLKWSEDLGVRVYWSMLCDFPGENDEWYSEMAAWLPRVFHLQPPLGLYPIRYDRFSPYQMRPGEYGVRMTPNWAYRSVYPLGPEAVTGLAYYFEDAEGSIRTGIPPGDPRRPGLAGVRDQIREWTGAYNGPRRPCLRTLEDDGERLLLEDTRFGVDRVELTGTAAGVYRRCDGTETLQNLRSEFGEGLESALADLEEKRAVLVQGGRALGLGLSGQGGRPASFRLYPGGFLRQRFHYV
ncbi:MAG: RiPP maturation radical SAM protein 1 [Armatimonadetes bacterium]|nr:RiPP maturation radical SAM protein 1 [Armatimonadota bacterium]